MAKPKKAEKPAKKTVSTAEPANDAPYKKPSWIPKSMAACADMMYDLDREFDRQKAVLDKIGERCTQMEDHIIMTLPASDATGIQGKKLRVSIGKRINAVLKEGASGWNVLTAYVKKTGQFDLLNKSINQAAIKERWENKKVVPGVTTFTKKTLNKHVLKGGR